MNNDMIVLHASVFHIESYFWGCHWSGGEEAQKYEVEPAKMEVGVGEGIDSRAPHLLYETLGTVHMQKLNQQIINKKQQKKASLPKWKFEKATSSRAV